MATPLGFSQLASLQSANSLAGIYGVHEARAALASSVTGQESPQQVAAIHQYDQALELKGAHDKIMFAAQQAMLESSERLRKQNTEQRQRLMDAGSIFV